MTNTEKKLDALIDALGFDVTITVDTKETPISKQSGINRLAIGVMGIKSGLVTDGCGVYKRGDDECYYLEASRDTDYKLTRKGWNSKPTLHKIIREYEKEGMSASEMIGRIMLMEGITNEEI